MAFEVLYCHAMQTPFGVLGRFAEAGFVGSSVTVSTDVGGPTMNTAVAMKLPAAVAPAINNHWESKQFTLAQPAAAWQFGFWVYFDNVNFHSGQNPVVFYQTMRNSLPDVSLELRYNASGHALHLINANGTSVDSDVNSFQDAVWNWVEGYSESGLVTILVGSLVKVNANSDFIGDATSDDQASMRYDGQTDSGSGPATITYIGPGYFSSGNNQGDDILTPLGGKKFECTTYRLGATSSKCDESDVNGNGEALSAGALINTADDDIATSADYIGISSGTIGATYAFDTSPGDGPAPNWNKWRLPFGMKYLWHTSGGTGGGTRVGRYGRYLRGSSNWSTAAIAIGNRIKYTEVFGLPGVGVFPVCPSELEVVAMGWFITDVINTFAARELYFFLWGLEVEDAGSYLMKSKKVGDQRSLVGTSGRVN